MIGAPDWIPFEPARWISGTAELDAMSEFVFFRLVVHAYERGAPIIEGTDRILALRCKVSGEVFADAVEILLEFRKIERCAGGFYIPTVERRLVDVATRQASRQRGAEIARRRKALKGEGRSDLEINQIISREFPDNQTGNQSGHLFGDQTDHQSDNQPYNNTRHDNTSHNRTGQDTKGGAGGNSDAQIAAELWNETADRASLPTVRLPLAAQRLSKLVKRLGECGGVDGWRAVLAKVEASDFLTGRKAGTDFRATLDFLLQPSSLAKVIEGNYDNRKGGASSATMREFARIRNG